jgi:hypothetical protein
MADLTSLFWECLQYKSPAVKEDDLTSTPALPKPFNGEAVHSWLFVFST